MPRLPNASYYLTYVLFIFTDDIGVAIPIKKFILEMYVQLVQVYHLLQSFPPRSPKCYIALKTNVPQTKSLDNTMTIFLNRIIILLLSDLPNNNCRSLAHVNKFFVLLEKLILLID